MKKRVLFLVLLLCVAGAVWLVIKKRGNNRGSLTLYGNVDIREVNLGFRVSGKVARLNFDEGDNVKAGEVIAKLDDEPFRNQVAASQAQVDSLRAKYSLRLNGYRKQEIAQAEAIVRQQEALLTNAKLQFQRQQDLFASGSKAVTAQDRDNAEAAYRQAEAQLNSARAQLSLLQEGYRAEDIAQAKADLAQAEAQLATAELQLRDAALTAPEDGVILTRAQEAGAILSPGATVFTLSLTKPVWVRAYVHESELGRIHPGSQIELFGDTHPKKKFHGKVGYISPRAEFTPKTVETPELRTSLVYRLRVVVEDADESLRQGMPVTVHVVN